MTGIAHDFDGYRDDARESTMVALLDARVGVWTAYGAGGSGGAGEERVKSSDLRFGRV